MLKASISEVFEKTLDASDFEKKNSKKFSWTPNLPKNFSFIKTFRELLA